MPPSGRIHRLRRRLLVLLTASGALVLASGGGFAALEDHVVSSYWTGVWWALSLMTTVGFVGQQPATASGRAVSGVLMVAGFGLMTVTTAAVASTLVREDEEPAALAERDFEEDLRDRLGDINARLERIEKAVEPGPEPGPSGGDVDQAT